MKRTITTTLLMGICMIFMTSLNAQDARSSAVLEKLSAKMKRMPSFSADFTSTLIDKQADMENTQKGNIKATDDKFELTLGENTVVSDGNVVWTYNSGSNEVMIDDLDEMFEDDISPTKLYSIWEEGFKNTYGGEESLDKVKCDIIKLFPDDPAEKNYHTIVLYVTSIDPTIKKVKILGKDGTDIAYSIDNFVKQSYPATRFRFNNSDYPGVEVIDNR
jgi:outer membrane lipoprotein-sorting protein